MSAGRNSNGGRERSALLLTVLLAAALLPAAVRGQGVLPPATGTPGVAGEVRTVAGRVLRGSSDSLQPLNGQVVVLHRISADSSGPVDSARTSAAGTYRFRYRLEGPRTMYIVSARYAGVAYFTSPLREASVTSPDADIAVYDTTSAAFPLSVRSRHVVISPADAGGVRRVVDVLEVANDSNRTLVAGRAGWTWRMTLPPGASEPGSSGGDLPPDAFRFSEGSAELLVPFPPGARQVVVTYAIPASGKVTIPVADPVSNLEVLLEGSGGSISGAGLSAEESVSMEGRSFRRFTAARVAAGESFVVAGAGILSGQSARLALLAVAAIAVALGVVFGRRAPAGAPVAAPAVTATAGTADAIAREIAALDHVYAPPARQAGSAGPHYRARREALLARLVEAQAVEERGPSA